jgi:hypothetical protein
MWREPRPARSAPASTHTVAGMKLQKVLLIPAVSAIAVGIATVAIADPPDGSRESNVSAPDANGTVTVTATVAPNQCQPVAGGPTATEAADTGQEPVDAAETGTASSVGVSSSRFDPYTCTPVPANATGTGGEKSPHAAGNETGQAPQQHYTPTLQPFPNSGESGDGPARGALGEPTTSVLLTPTPTGTHP